MAANHLLAALADELGLSRSSGPKFWYWLARTYFWSGSNRKAVICIRLGQYFHRRGWKRLARSVEVSLRRDFGTMVSVHAEIGPGLRLPHPTGIIIGEGVRIGAGCTIYQQVTIGGARLGDWKAGRYPEIGDNAVLFAGSKIVGALTIGNGVTVGANAVVTRDVPDHHIAVGIPAVAKPGRA